MKDQSYKISIILLAAGNSKRFQGNKLLTAVEGKPMYLHMVDKIKDISAEMIVLVTQYDEISHYICDNSAYNNISVVNNNQSELGISHSIKLGLEYCIKSGELGKKEPSEGIPPHAYLFAVCDQPWLRKESIHKLIAEFLHSSKRIACLSYQGKLGNPVIFDKIYEQELLELTGDVGGKNVVKRHLEDVIIVEAKDYRELADIDTKQDCIL
jgi:molybdenum cofactor cytidylyltransferase